MSGLNGNANKYLFFVSAVLVLVLNQSSVNGLPFGQTFTVEPKGQHQATVVWLHGITENGFRWSNVLKMLGCNGIKFIVPTAPLRPVSGMGFAPTTAWFDVGPITPNGFVDTKGLDATLRQCVDLLSQEPSNVLLGIGGFSLGSATTLYATATYARGTYSDGSPFPIKFTAAVALSGWLPGFGFIWRGKFASPDAQARAASLPVLQAHGTMDPIVPFALGSLSSNSQRQMGFSNLVFKTHPGRGHMYYPGELQEMCSFYQRQFGISSA